MKSECFPCAMILLAVLLHPCKFRTQKKETTNVAVILNILTLFNCNCFK